MSIWAGPLSYLYQSVTDVKNDLFTKQALKIHRVPVPVISIGNLTVGGTGKTPFTDYTLKYFLNQGLKVAVISRAYKAKAKQPVRVDPSRPDASGLYGDEPLWLARENPRAAVFVGRQKWRIAEEACRQERWDLLIVDDGFQHRRLHRDLDILILDATEKAQNYEVLPAGRAREKFENIQRADLVVLSKCHQASAAELQELRARIPTEKTRVETGFRISQFRNLRGGERRSRAAFAGAESLLFCSIARPESFQRSLAEIFVRSSLMSFPDHHPYHPDDVESILQRRQKENLKFVCCTEKDAVKLESLWPEGEDLWVAELELEILSHRDELHALYHRFCS